MDLFRSFWSRCREFRSTSCRRSAYRVSNGFSLRVAVWRRPRRWPRALVRPPPMRPLAPRRRAPSSARTPAWVVSSVPRLAQRALLARRHCHTPPVARLTRSIGRPVTLLAGSAWALDWLLHAFGRDRRIVDALIDTDDASGRSFAIGARGMHRLERLP